ncbi:amino acid/polyamine/organocation transporter, APC superfamily (TC 2.A.3) [Saccharopolyspora kobensis]|uniref:Amino acid/polyamine/organocation transporter, APC superfamily n=1 Tax=Saccharopolyspora kobensis TaxID=146035 RepID=A0A1H6A859_9PSEU|nr:APC family permease [Saccharopolyspora kobensis]SEG44631.1 amino acid/polyamine/organocation transporter, APC superfamily (TC 2.A.3) [Saccharopolyspora kobensis]SFE51920.1 amino acid/polyamine/organocation transporter, APC superfamily [Saccharopolyspora kobensis]
MAELHDFQDSDSKLRRDLSAQQLLFISIGSIIGSGWLFAVLSAGAVAGPAVIVAWVITAILISVLALNYAETGSMIPRSGGIARYPYLTHGNYLGFLLSWSMLLGGVTTVAIEALAVVQYAAGYVTTWTGVELTSQGDDGSTLTGTGRVVAVVVMLLFFCVNVFGIRFFGKFNQWVSWWKLIIPVLTFLLLFTVFDGSNFTGHGGFAPQGWGAVFNAIAVSGIVFAFQGFREGVNFGGEARNPQRNIFIATVGSVAICAVIFVLLQVAFIGALDWGSTGVAPGDWSGLEGSRWADQPLYSALESTGIALLGAFGVFLLIDAAISPAGTGWIYLGDTARTLYGMALHGSMPKAFARVGERTRVPWLGMVACLVAGCAFFLPFPGWYKLIGYTSSTAVITYLAAAPQLQVMRRVVPDAPRPFFLRASKLLSPLGFLAASMILYWSGYEVLQGVVATVLVALPIYALYQGPRQGRMPMSAATWLGAVFAVLWIATQVIGPLGTDSLPFLAFWSLSAAEVLGFTGLLWLISTPEGRREIRASNWAVALTMVLYLVSYYGAYGTAAAPLLPFPWDSAVAAALGLVAYYWAVGSGYSTQELRASLSGADDPEGARNG